MGQDIWAQSGAEKTLFRERNGSHWSNDCSKINEIQNETNLGRIVEQDNVAYDLYWKWADQMTAYPTPAEG